MAVLFFSNFRNIYEIKETAGKNRCSFIFWPQKYFLSNELPASHTRGKTVTLNIEQKRAYLPLTKMPDKWGCFGVLKLYMTKI